MCCNRRWVLIGQKIFVWVTIFSWTQTVCYVNWWHLWPADGVNLFRPPWVSCNRGWRPCPIFELHSWRKSWKTWVRLARECWAQLFYIQDKLHVCLTFLSCVLPPSWVCVCCAWMQDTDTWRTASVLKNDQSGRIERKIQGSSQMWHARKEASHLAYTRLLF